VRTARTVSPRGIESDGASVHPLRGALRHPVILPGDPGYDEARRVWNGMIDRHPAAVARCAEAAEVAAAVGIARRNGLPLAVRGGGHSVAGHSTCDGGIVVDLSPMDSVVVDPGSRIVRVGGGATWGSVDRETQRFGLAVPGGVVSHTGVAGLSLGGGYGWLRRKYGLSCDHVLSAEVVLADGRTVTASETRNADLLWALKGGGGNFGIVTTFEFRAVPVGPEVMYVGSMYPVEQAGAVLRAWRDYVGGAPDEVTSDATWWSVPPDPAIPAELHGAPVLVVEGVYAGPVDAGERMMRPLRELGDPLLDLSGPELFTDVNSALDDVFPAGAHHSYWRSHYLAELGDEAIDSYVRWAERRPSRLSPIPIRHLGGAMSRVAAEDTALGDRSARFLLSIDSVWESPADTARNVEWTRAFWAEMQRFATGAAYTNFLSPLDSGDELLKRTYGANYRRLVELKRKYDPENLFRLNHNIDPDPERAT
jgi:FAD/FMN-containing dehydrogenase